MSKNQNMSVGKTFLLGFQHVFAMFGATVLVPMLTGLSMSATLLFAGLGTLLFHLLTKRKVPAFLGSSFAFLGGYAAIASMVKDYNAANGTELNWVPYAGVGVMCAGLLYVLVSQLFRVFGAKKVMRFFPPIVTGPIIICVGMNLASSAINNCVANWWIAILAVVIVVVANIWGKGMVKIVPILLGVLGSYVVAAIFAATTGTMVNLGTEEAPNMVLCAFGNANMQIFSAANLDNLHNAAWIGLPFDLKDSAFSLFGNVNSGLLISSILAMMPLSLATMIEHIGDMCAISSTVGEDFVADPGLHRTLLGDGLATTLAATFGAPANTTYGENTGVLALTKVYDPKVVELAAIIAAVFSFCPKISALITLMPTATIGGVSLILYGMISAVGIRNLVENSVDFTQSRNIIIAALILSLDLGITYSGAVIGFTAGTVTISLSGLAVAAIIGILLNAILPGNDYEFGKNPTGDKNRGIHFPAEGE